MAIRRGAVFMIIGLMGWLLLSACAGEAPPEPPPPPPTAEELAAQEEARKEAEAARLRAAEEAKKPPQMFYAETRAMYEGPENRPPPPSPPETPYDEAFPPKSLLPPPVRVGVMSAPESVETGEKVSLMLREVNRAEIEENIGRDLNVVVVSRSSGVREGMTEIHYRTGHLRAALEIAAAIPNKQHIEPMTFLEEAREGFDVLVYVGEDLR